MSKRIENIIDDIKKTGLDLEIVATSKLEDAGWRVHNQEGYLDCDEKKWRTIDIIGTKRIELPITECKTLHVSLIIECKKSEKPWIFYTREKDSTTFNPIMAMELIKNKTDVAISPFIFSALSKHFHYFSPEFRNVGVIPYEAFTKQNGRSDIFKGTNQVIKALNHNNKKFKRMLAQFNTINKKTSKASKLKILCLSYPIIVFDGDLYTFTYINQEVKLTPSNYVQYFVSYESQLGKSGLFVIDIVKVNFLDKFLELIDNEVNVFKEKIIEISKNKKP